MITKDSIGVFLDMFSTVPVYLIVYWIEWMLQILGFAAFYQNAFFKEKDNLWDVLPPCGIKCIGRLVA